jgi:hypothetical protein
MRRNLLNRMYYRVSHVRMLSQGDPGLNVRGILNLKMSPRQAKFHEFDLFIAMSDS